MSEKGIDGITIDYDTADRIALAVLVDHYEMNEDQINKLTKKKKLAEYEQGDLEDSYELRLHLKKIIAYFTTPDQYEKIVG